MMIANLVARATCATGSEIDSAARRRRLGRSAAWRV